MNRLAFATIFLVSLIIVRGQTSDETETEAPPPGQPKIITAKPLPPLHLPDNVEELKDVVIGMGGTRDLHADILRLKTPPVAPMPAIILIHGGGWKQGSYHRVNATVPFAVKGYFVASIEYRLSPEALWPAQIEDCKLGVRWLRANAAKYHVDPNRIGCWGTSAGGHLVACLGTMGDEGKFEGDGGYSGVSSRVQAVADFSGPTDFTEGSEGLTGSNADHEAPILDALIGSTFAQKPEAWKQASPIVFVKTDDPPFLVVHGDADRTVPYDQSKKFVAALQKAGVSVQFLTVHGGGHGLRAYPGQPTASPEPKVIATTVQEFFDKKLGAIPPSSQKGSEASDDHALNRL
jgi:acetyl esterase/lipase